MKLHLVIIFSLAVPAISSAQSVPEDISPSRLQAILGLPLNEAIKQRAIYKEPLRSAYERQISMSNKDCSVEINQGQQPYNICIGRAAEQTDNDYAIFYNNLQLLCHDQDQLKTLQDSEKVWRTYRDALEKATHASWPEGTGAPGFGGEVYLLLVRNRMRELSHTPPSQDAILAGTVPPQGFIRPACSSKPVVLQFMESMPTSLTSK
jgi:uncharacterized protein YecT (DUF1311 family)